MRLDHTRDLVTQMLQSLYDAEKQLVIALPRVAARVASPTMRDALRAHLDATRTHVVRLERVAAVLGVPCSGKLSLAMQGLLKEGDEAAGYGGDGLLVDAAVRVVCQAIEQFEITHYQALIEHCEGLGADEVTSLLMTTLSEEEAMLDQLDDIGAEPDGAVEGGSESERPENRRATPPL